MSHMAFEAFLAFVVLVLCVLAMRVDRQLRTLRQAFQDLLNGQGIQDLLLQAKTLPEDALPILVVMAAYNEGTSIGHVLRSLPPSIEGIPVRPVVVVDGGHDDTDQVARAHGSLVTVCPINRGQGAALRLGFRFAEVYGCRAVITMDADGQHDASFIEALVQPILRGQADMVIGTRNQERIDATSSMRKMGMIFLNAFLRALGLRITDCSSGFRAYHPSALPRLVTHDPQYSGGELLVLAARSRLRIKETAVKMHRRLQGQSKKGSDLRFAVRFTLAMVRAAIRPRLNADHFYPNPSLKALTKEERDT